ncbi:MAG: cyclic nucleotide-binding domain-containing protein [Desulfobacteraceae bacterium]|nr:MAG: cyclic nucleotide-binding domain-containing protein [Desulfobacteraceae bacterium]
MTPVEKRNIEGKVITQNRYAEILEKTRWATEFTWQEICQICEYVKPVKAKTGAVIFHEGEVDKSLGIIVKGAIDITKDDGADRKKITTLTSSQTFGEMALIDGEPRSATGIAAQETIIFYITAYNMAALCDENPKLGIKFLWKISKTISQRLRSTTGRLIDLM